MKNIILNHQPHQTDATTLAALLASLGQDKPGVALAINGQVVPRRHWPETELNEGDRLDLFSVIAGG
ncbi:thiamine biosynthesis protein ThiS [Ferrimonas balearica DSM 9799]|uniref:Thiamine biosynthesis protein ThiS n=1 Tax=Ferrimonas balearica (strain DSM 9799 / CCM 4581 / KCTC 23876 / PAT) TaxID=550540 RepID=E1SUA1_FERBD|nr:sulfur carrier protein ThiS [Ferrimonas balearica]ADN76234.1 thiamine biosynthesis protein ThiS [Ferrimonas balearica DSM 9799]MBW3163266.1 sulfur carrier protein ThiS [Ferrimonas balearica]MBY5980962.1 sulfur carrier protein ThiS [Ferrimonas balearica]MBY6223216.1 sulfur carrier protein ThiS [Ferrimonas balearica]